MALLIDSFGSVARAPNLPSPADFDASVAAQREVAAQPAAAPQTVAARQDEGEPVVPPWQPPLVEPEPEEPSAQRKADIDGWVEHSSDASGGFLGIGETSSAEHVHNTLKGDSELGELTPAEQGYLTDKALDRWLRDGWSSEPGDLADRVKGDAGLRVIVGERFAARAARLMQEPKGNGSLSDPHSHARALSMSVVDMLGEDKAGLAEALQGLTPEEGARFVQSLDMGDGLNGGVMIEPYQKILTALNDAPPSQTTSAIVQNLFAQIDPVEVANAPDLRRELAFAIAREWHPETDAASVSSRDAAASRLEALMGSREGQRLLFSGQLEKDLAGLAAVRADPSITADLLKGHSGDPLGHPVVARAVAGVLVPPNTPNREAEVSRITGILQTEQGRELLFGSPIGNSVPPEARAMARDILLSDPTITADTLRNPPSPSVHDGSDPWLDRDNPWHNPVIVDAVARANAASFSSDAPIAVSGRNIDNLVGTAMGARVALPEGMSEQDAYAGAQSGNVSLYEAGPDAGIVSPVADAIRRTGGDNAQVTTLPITFSSAATGPVRLPLFRVQTPQGDKFVDNKGAVYNSFDHWRTANQLPPGLVVYPQDGHVSVNADGSPKLASEYTPKTANTTGEKISTVVDGAALVGGILAGGALIIGTGGVAGVVFAGVGIGAGAWGAWREGSALYERGQLGLSTNPFTDGEARSLWLGLGANLTGMGAFASEAALLRFVRNSSALTKPAALTIGTARVSANVTNAAAFANEGAAIIANWDQMTPEQRATALLQMGFWATTTGVASRQARSFGELINPAAAARTVMGAYQPPVVRDSLLEGDRVEIRVDPATGNPVIHAAELASPEKIQSHVNVVRAMARDRGLTGWVQQLGGEPAPGTLAYSLKYETIKLGNRLKVLEGELNAPGLTPERRAQIDDEVATITAYQDQLAETAGRIAADPGQADIAGPSTGYARAVEVAPELADALPPGYIWRSQGVDRDPEILRREASGDYPMLALVKADGEPSGYKIITVPNKANEPVIASETKGIGLRSSLDEPGFQDQFDTAIATRADLVQQRTDLLAGRRYDELEGADLASYRALDKQVKDQSHLIGELGAVAHVNAHYPGAQRIYGGPGSESQPGDFDVVFRQDLGDGSVRFIVIEAKGGSSPLGTKMVNGQLETQGTSKYFEAIADNMQTMKSKNPGADETGAMLLNALDGSVDGKPAQVVYIATRSGVDGLNANVTSKQFALGQR